MSASNAVIDATLTIVNGPSAADIANSLLYAYGRHKLPVTFTASTVVAGKTIHSMEFEANVIGISYSKGESGAFILDLYITEGYNGRGNRCQGPYDAIMRTGTFSLG